MTLRRDFTSPLYLCLFHVVSLFVWRLFFVFKSNVSMIFITWNWKFVTRIKSDVLIDLLILCASQKETHGWIDQ